MVAASAAKGGGEGAPQGAPMWAYGCNDHLDLDAKAMSAGFHSSGILLQDYQEICRKVEVIPHPALRVEAPEGEKATAPLPSPHLAVRSSMMDRPSMQIISFLLPLAQHLRVLCFSDCRLDGEMLGLLRRGLEGNCNLEALQIEWNPLELPLPTAEEVEAAPPEDLADLVLLGPGGLVDRGGVELRERYRCRLQSQRCLRAFRDWLVDLGGGSLGAAWQKLASPPGSPEGDQLLTAAAFHDLLDAKLGAVGAQVVEAFEALDSPDYAAGAGRTSLSKLRAALDALQEEPAAAGGAGGGGDRIGGMLSPFMDGDCVVESCSLRACNLGWQEIVPMAEALTKSPWQLRSLNLWGNRICNRSAATLAEALTTYRGLEFLGLGKNRITDKGLAALCKPFQAVSLTDEGKKAAEASIKAQETQLAAAAKAAAKAKGKAAPKGAAQQGRAKREAKTLLDQLEECLPVVEGGEPSYLQRRPSELKLLTVSENPIRNARTVETLQPLGPKGVELHMKQTRAAQNLLTKRPELASSKGDKKPSFFCPGGEGWVVYVV